MDRLYTSNNKIYTLIVIILSLLLMVQEIKSRSMGKSTSDNYPNIHSIMRHVNLRHLRSRIHSHSNSPMDHLLYHNHHLLKKRNDEGVRYATINDKDQKALQHLADNDNKKYEILVKDAQNSSLCNYTVTPLKNLEDYEVPKGLVDITCNSRGSRCQKSGTYCCIQTYTKIHVILKNGGKKKPIRINTGCVCAQLLGDLEKKQLHPDTTL